VLTHDEITEDTIAATLAVLDSHGPTALLVDDLQPAEVARLAWSGSSSHLASVARALEQVPSGTMAYLVVRAPTGEPVAKCCIDYTHHSGAGTLIHLVTHDRLQGRGLATYLITTAEQRIRHRGLSWAVLGVEEDNPRARALYERLGYTAWQREYASWPEEDEAGNMRLYETELVILRKAL
jgi:ribosomal protein S18 acetylase RimI-like enzyme